MKQASRTPPTQAPGSASRIEKDASASQPQSAAPRTAGGRFQPGTSGNPAGRPRSGSAALRESLAARGEEILQPVIHAALNGDMTAARMILDRILPPLRPHGETVSIALPASASPATSAAAILHAAVSGSISPDAAGQLLTAAASLSRIVETEELKTRLEALERAVAPPTVSGFPHFYSG